MQQKPHKNTNMEFSGRATGYTRRPVAGVRPRYRTAPANTMLTQTITSVDGVVGKPQPQRTHVVALPAEPRKQTGLASHTAHAALPKQIVKKKPVHHTPSNQKPLRQSQIPTNIAVSKPRHIQPLDNVPTLPQPRQKRLRKVIHTFKHASRRKKSGYILSALAILLLFGGVALNIYSFSVTKKIDAHANALSGNSNESEESGRPGESAGLSEQEPDAQAMRQYTVAPELPKYVKIPSIGTYARVKRVGVDANSQIGTPKNVFDTAWYDGSAKPGQPGAVFIDGHVLGPTKGGVFAKLKKVKTGDKVVITTGDNTDYIYRVVTTEIANANAVDMAKALRSIDPNKQGLTLMTCNGAYQKDAETFDKRLIVYAVREN